METALYLIPVTLGETPVSQVLPAYNHDVILGIRHFIVENVRSARRFLRLVDHEFPIDDSTFYEMGKHAQADQFASYLKPLQQGFPVGVISEAGCPAVADPGAEVVAMAQHKGFRVIPLVGPSSMIMAVMASGLNGQSFAFNGYLPVDE
ncbi:MAG: SAM-dependent methyltransferase, partial [Bacteroidaceae bacterium]|nr:SAM-dependent methyltransferase [Bacteroidaceae bacterium]